MSQDDKRNPQRDFSLLLGGGDEGGFGGSHPFDNPFRQETEPVVHQHIHVEVDPREMTDGDPLGDWSGVPNNTGLPAHIADHVKATEGEEGLRRLTARVAERADSTIAQIKQLIGGNAPGGRALPPPEVHVEFQPLTLGLIFKGAGVEKDRTLLTVRVERFEDGDDSGYHVHPNGTLPTDLDDLIWARAANAVATLADAVRRDGAEAVEAAAADRGGDLYWAIQSSGPGEGHG